MIIMLANYAWKIKTKKIFRNILITSHFQVKNIIPAIAAGSLFLSGYYYMQNIYSVSDIAQKGNDLLYKANKKTFVPVTASVVLAMSVIGFTCFRGMSFLVDIARTVIYLTSLQLKKLCKK